MVARYQPVFKRGVHSSTREDDRLRKGDGIWHPVHGNGFVTSYKRGEDGYIIVRFWERYQGKKVPPLPEHVLKFRWNRIEFFNERLNQWFLKKPIVKRYRSL